MKGLFLILHLVFAISLAGLILLQSSKGGLASGLSTGEFYRSRRGAERMVFIATCIATVLFLVTSLANILLR
ncbi:preprotein translocase subunit SecG [Candidatus Gottesmanbacteria bacterium]|nr:preprotein translocase subunit SecG [Candidatus Gottesmanbacteria bacterium]